MSSPDVGERVSVLEMRADVEEQRSSALEARMGLLEAGHRRNIAVLLRMQTDLQQCEKSVQEAIEQMRLDAL